jgi:predicted outer membrane lipoprotein
MSFILGCLLGAAIVLIIWAIVNHVEDKKRASYDPNE